MPDRQVIIDTSPLFYLRQVGHLNLLPTLYSRITVPTAVQRELQAGQAQGLEIPIIEQLDWVTLASANANFLPNITDLGAGEAEVIALGIENPGSLLILDDTLGRSIAHLYQLTYTGTLGVLIRAKELGHIPSVLPVVQSLQAQGMWIAQSVIENVLELAGETP
jgi:predicted nucleic acid-binding protein